MALSVNKSSTVGSSTVGSIEALNVSVVVGSLARNPIRRQLKNKDEVLNLDVRVKTGELKTVVPVTWMNPPVWALKLTAGTCVGVRGSVRQLWYGNNSRFTDLLASKVVRIAGASSHRRFLDDTLAVIEELERPMIA